MYRVTKLVDTIAQELEDNDPSPLKSSGFTSWNPSTVNARIRFAKERKVSARHAAFLFGDAIQNGYLMGSTKKSNGEDVDVVELTTKGRELIDTTVLIPIPIGLWMAWFKKFGAFFIGFFSGLVVPALISVIKLIVDNLH